MHDLCHAFNLIVQDCVKIFPKAYRDIVKNISALFARSPNQTARLKAVMRQRAVEDPSNKAKLIGSYIKTRWSSFKTCLDIIIEQAESLYAYFVAEEDHGRAAYFNTANLLMLRLFSSLLGKIHYYIMEFQKDDLDMIHVVKTLKMCPASIGGYLFRQENRPKGRRKYFEQFQDMQPLLSLNQDSEEYKARQFSEADFAAYLMERNPDLRLYHDQSTEFQTQFMNTAMNFMKAAFEGIKQRLPSTTSDIMLADSLLLNDESDINSLRRIQNLSSCLEGWSKESQFPLIFRLAKAIQVLPYSSVPVERHFSVATDIKTIKRNNLTVDSVQACLLSKQFFQADELYFNSEMQQKYRQLLNNKNDMVPEDSITPATTNLFDENTAIQNPSSMEEEKVPLDRPIVAAFRNSSSTDYPFLFYFPSQAPLTQAQELALALNIQNISRYPSVEGRFPIIDSSLFESMVIAKRPHPTELDSHTLKQAKPLGELNELHTLAELESASGRGQILE